MRLPTPNYLAASFYSEASNFPPAATTPRSVCAFKTSTMGGNPDPRSSEEIQGIIAQLLQKLPQNERAQVLRGLVDIYGIRETSDELSGTASNGQRAKRAKKPSQISQRSAAGDSASPFSTPGAEPVPDKEGHLCGFCKEMDHVVVCARKNDLKRHMGDFHHIVTEFICPVEDCTFRTESKKRFSQHIKIDGRHKQVVSNNEMHVHENTVCEPLVFACGFDNCSVLLEAPPEGDGGKTFREYIEHVIKHYDEEKCANWSYSTRIRNLLRQSRMQGALQNVDLSSLEWGWNRSTDLRRDLITGTIENKAGMLQRAIHTSGNHGRDDMQRRPMLDMPRAVAARPKEIGRRRNRIRRSPVNTIAPAQYDCSSSFHAHIPEPLTTPDMALGRSSDPSPSPVTYHNGMHTTPPTTMGEVMHHVYAGGSSEVFMGADVSPLDPQLYPGVPTQHGYSSQRELPAFGMHDGYTMIDVETGFLRPGMNNHKF
ncbi:hypothetical protein MY4824_001404 [Beauveria thailandica]